MNERHVGGSPNTEQVFNLSKSLLTENEATRIVLDTIEPDGVQLLRIRFETREGFFVLTDIRAPGAEMICSWGFNVSGVSPDLFRSELARIYKERRTALLNMNPNRMEGT